VKDMMRKKRLTIIVSVAVLSVVMLVSAAALYNTLLFRMNATVVESGTVIVVVDGTTYTNGQSLSINWGNVTTGNYTKAINITSTVNTPVTPAIVTTGLPSGWALALSDVSPIPAYGNVTRNLVLTVPSHPLSGTPNWNTTLTVSS
jgi:hypothetical protein